MCGEGRKAYLRRRETKGRASALRGTAHWQRSRGGPRSRPRSDQILDIKHRIFNFKRNTKQVTKQDDDNNGRIRKGGHKEEESEIRRIVPLCILPATGCSAGQVASTGPPPLAPSPVRTKVLFENCWVQFGRLLFNYLLLSG